VANTLPVVMSTMDTVTSNGFFDTLTKSHSTEVPAAIKTGADDRVVVAIAGDTRNVRIDAAISLFIGVFLPQLSSILAIGTHTGLSVPPLSMAWPHFGLTRWTEAATVVGVPLGAGDASEKVSTVTLRERAFMSPMSQSRPRYSHTPSWQ
jgi:hypothetical protein